MDKHHAQRNGAAETEADQFSLNGQTLAEAEAERRALEREAAALPDAPLMDEEDLERLAYREASQRLLQMDMALCATLAHFKGSALVNRGFRFVWECSLAAKGYWHILGVANMNELAGRWHCTKANVGKVVERLQQFTNLPPIPGQRELESRRTMSRARKEQLKVRVENSER